MIRGEINESDTKKTIAKIKEIKSWFFEKIKLYCMTKTTTIL